jgi:dolichyl-phosphate-mannose-protein mannosyltransferase
MALLLIPFSFGLILFWNASAPAQFCFDEHYFVPSARALLAGTGWMEMSHPPFGKALIAVSIYLFGDTPLSWRIPSILSTIASSWYLGKIACLTGLKTRVAQIVQLVFFAEGLVFTQARVGILNAPMLLCMLVALTYALEWRKGGGTDRGMIFRASFMVGIGMGIRWVAISIIPLLVVTFLYPGTRKIQLKVSLVAIGISTFIIAYILSLLPFLLHQELSLSRIIELQLRQLLYHIHLTTPHRYESPWWSWPFMIRPIWFGFERAAIDSSGIQLVRGIVAIGNPAVIWSSLPLAFYLLMEFYRKRTFATLLIVFGFLQQWLQWALSPHYTMFHYFYTAVPFIALGIGLVTERLQQTTKGRIFIGLWVLSITVLFIYWYPLFSCEWISDNYYKNHLWFTSWR